MVLLNPPEEPNKSDGEEESSISLSDLPMSSPTESNGPDSPTHHYPPEPDFFELLFTSSSPSSSMCFADDIFLRGKILPFGAPPPTPPKRSETHVAKTRPHFAHRQTDSLDAGGFKHGCWSGGITGEYRKLSRVSNSNPQKAKPRWYVVLFGPVRVPEAMEIREIRTRQRRRSQTLIGSNSGGSGFDGRRGPWKLLRPLSCKAVESVAVAGPALASF